MLIYQAQRSDRFFANELTFPIVFYCLNYSVKYNAIALLITHFGSSKNKKNHTVICDGEKFQTNHSVLFVHMKFA